MKLLVTTFFLLFLISQKSFGQDTTAQINASWTSLKTQLQRRTDIVSKLTAILSKSSIVDRVQLNNSRTFAIDLFKYVDTLTLKDSQSVSLAAKKNNKLTQALSRTLVTLELDNKFRANIEVRELLMNLEGCENRIVLAKQDYNDICKKLKRMDLLFGADQIEKAPVIKF